VAIADGREVYAGPCGVRAITDESGSLKRIVEIE
jgi:hypothetical protein